jgi:hypothetical protein
MMVGVQRALRVTAILALGATVGFGLASCGSSSKPTTAPPGTLVFTHGADITDSAEFTDSWELYFRECPAPPTSSQQRRTTLYTRSEVEEAFAHQGLALHWTPWAGKYKAIIIGQFELDQSEFSTPNFTGPRLIVTVFAKPLARKDPNCASKVTEDIDLHVRNLSILIWAPPPARLVQLTRSALAELRARSR